MFDMQQDKAAVTCHAVVQLLKAAVQVFKSTCLVAHGTGSDYTNVMNRCTALAQSNGPTALLYKFAYQGC
jgi:hypothetical protein